MMRIGVCASPEQLAGADVTGLDYVEANVQALLVPQADASAFAAQQEHVRACPVPVRAANCFLPGGLKTTGPAVDMAALEAYVRTAFARAERIGIRTIVFGSGGSRMVPEGFSPLKAMQQLSGFLARIAPLAADHGVTIVVEPLQHSECNIVNTVDDGRMLVLDVEHPSVRLLADVYHMLRNHETPDAIRRAGGLLRHTHTAEREKRTPPGVAGDDIRPYLAALKEVGYPGAMSIEANWTDLRAQLPAAVRELRRQIEEA